MPSPSLVDDLSARDRLGFAGPGANRQLRTLSLLPPDARFACTEQSDGSLLVKVSSGEFLWLSGSRQQEPMSSRNTIPADSSDCHRLHWRSSHAWFSLSGTDARGTLAELCALDLHPTKFPNLSCAPTMLARIPVLLIRWDADDALRLHLLIPRPHAAAVLDWLAQR